MFRNYYNCFNNIDNHIDMTKNDRKRQTILFKSLDNIYNKSVSVSKSFGLNAISLKLLEANIKLSKIKPTDSNKIIHEWIDQHNKLLDDIYTTCEGYVKGIKAEHCSKEFLKICINKAKEAYKAGMNEANN